MTFEQDVPTIQASAGLQYGIRYTDEDVIYLGLEYFYNERGFDSYNDAIVDALAGKDLASIIDDFSTGNLLGLAEGLQPFYIGKHYAAAFVLFPGLGTNDDMSIGLSAIANLSDRSAVVRCDFGTQFLTHLKLETYAQVNVGEPGELKFGGDAVDPNAITDALGLTESPDSVPSLTIPNAVAQVGINLRMNF